MSDNRSQVSEITLNQKSMIDVKSSEVVQLKNHKHNDFTGSYKDSLLSSSQTSDSLITDRLRESF